MYGILYLCGFPDSLGNTRPRAVMVVSGISPVCKGWAYPLDLRIIKLLTGLLRGDKYVWFEKLITNGSSCILR